MKMSHLQASSLQHQRRWPDSAERKIQGSFSYPRKTLEQGKESTTTEHLLCDRASVNTLSPLVPTKLRKVVD